MGEFFKKMIKNYDIDNDILSIHKGFSDDEKFKGNIDLGDLTLDLSTKGSIKGLEILNASIFLKDFGISEEMLKGLKSVDFNTLQRGKSIMLSIDLKSKNESKKAKIAVPVAN